MLICINIMQILIFGAFFMQLDKIVKELMQNHSQAEIAQFANVNQSTISRILNGRSTSYKTANKIEEMHKKSKTPSGH